MNARYLISVCLAYLLMIGCAQEVPRWQPPEQNEPGQEGELAFKFTEGHNDDGTLKGRIEHAQKHLSEIDEVLTQALDSAEGESYDALKQVEDQLTTSRDEVQMALDLSHSFCEDEEDEEDEQQDAAMELLMWAALDLNEAFITMTEVIAINSDYKPIQGEIESTRVELAKIVVDMGGSVEYY